MAAQAPKTYMEGIMGLLSQLATLEAAPDANLDEISNFRNQLLSIVRKPIDTPAQGSPLTSSLDLSNGASAPPQGQVPGAMSPMLAALMGAQQPGPAMGGMAPGAAPGSFPTHGLMAGPAAPPNMDEVRRMLQVPGARGA